MRTNNIGEPARAAFETALADGRRRLEAREFEAAWRALEQAHVLGQPAAWLHVRSHWWMLKCGLREADVREVVGQLVRVALAAPASWGGRYPKGNTGRARVGLFTPMKLEPEVEAILSGTRDPAGRLPENR